jgi:hypothetical protein
VLREDPIAGRLRAMLGRAVILALVLCAAARSAAAEPDYERAKQHYQAAEKAAAAGDHALAAREYGIAYDITKDPVLFFKIGQAYDRAGDCTSAKVYYLRYLKEGKPAPEYRKRTEALVAACKNRSASAAQSSSGAAAGAASGATAPSPDSGSPSPDPQASPDPSSEEAPDASGDASSDASPDPSTGAASGAPPTDAPPTGARAATRTGPPPPDAAPSPRPARAGQPRRADVEEIGWERTAAWSTVGITFALGTAAAVLGLSAASREEDIENLINFRDPEGQPAIYTGATRDRYRDLVDEGKRLERLSVAALIATGGAAAAATVFFVLDGMRPDDQDDQGAELERQRSGLTPAVTPGGAGLSWTGSF